MNTLPHYHYQQLGQMAMSRLYLVCLALFIVSACQSRHSEWDELDYSRIARQNQARENDTNYRPPVPTAIGCADDDLYNCR